MSDYVTKSDLANELRQQTDEIVGVIESFMSQVDNRFNQVEAKVSQFDTKFDRLVNTIDGFVGRIDHYETEQAARDRQFDRLLEWARKVSKKTGIPLEDL